MSFLVKIFHGEIAKWRDKLQAPQVRHRVWISAHHPRLGGPWQYKSEYQGTDSALCPQPRRGKGAGTDLKGRELQPIPYLQVLAVCRAPTQERRGGRY